MIHKQKVLGTSNESETHNYTSILSLQIIIVNFYYQLNYLFNVLEVQDKYIPLLNVLEARAI